MSTESRNLTGVIARKDFEDAVRSKMLLSLTGVIVAIVGLVYVGAWWASDGSTDADGGVAILSILFQIFVPLIALIAGYMSVVGERKSGSIKLLLGLPPKRSHIVFGKLIGRAGVVGVTVLIGALASGVLSLLLFQSLPATELLGVTAASLLLGFAFVGIAVGISAAVSSRGRAMASVIGFYMICLLFWDILTAGVYRLVEGSLPAGPEYEAWYMFLQWLNPLNAHAVLLNGVLENQPPNFTIALFGPANAADLDRYLAGEAPIYLQDWVPVVIFTALAVVPVALGYLRFRSTDLG